MDKENRGVPTAADAAIDLMVAKKTQLEGVHKLSDLLGKGGANGMALTNYHTSELTSAVVGAVKAKNMQRFADCLDGKVD